MCKNPLYKHIKIYTIIYRCLETGRRKIPARDPVLEVEMEHKVERYGVLELSFEGCREGEVQNPFTDCTIRGLFLSKNERIETEGFYNGKGQYLIRFMPSFTGNYEYEVSGSFSETVYKGSFQVGEAAGDNHGPVKVADTFHFAYADGTPYYQIGTTCYAWLHQEDKMQEQTLETLKNSPFNKIRFCVFPKHYDYNLYEPLSYPFEGKPCGIEGISKENFLDFTPDNPENKWDFTRFNIAHFEILDRRIQDLLKLGIQADIILFHPYDRWGFSKMNREADERYVRYMAARYAAFRNVWWSLANEYDLFPEKTVEDFENIASVICEKDPYVRLRSIHNCKKIYDFTRPWITHCSIQRTEIYESAARTKLWRQQYQKPVVLDEVGYEGDINYSWGNLTQEEMVHLFWTATVRGGYCGHGETYLHPKNKLWWSHGGSLRGESAKRLEFLRKEVLEKVPGLGLKPGEINKWEDNCGVPEHIGYCGKYYLFYTGRSRPGFREFALREDKEYQAEVIDTWNMTIENRGIFSGKFYIELPGRQYMAIRIQEKEKETA